MFIETKNLDEHTILLTINRPESKNALNTELLAELESTLQSINPRVLIITGNGNVFCAGADLKERSTMTPKEANDVSLNIGRKIKMIEDLPYVTIAAMNGSAYGGGLELALACDFRIMGREVKVGLTETSLGIIPGAGGTQRLPRIVGIPHAKEMIYTAEVINAKKALTIGLANEITDDVVRSAHNLATRITKNAPLSLKASKQAIQQGMDVSLEESLKVERACYDQILNTEDRIEGLNAFKEKRQPIYKGK